MKILIALVFAMSLSGCSIFSLFSDDGHRHASEEHHGGCKLAYENHECEDFNDRANHHDKPTTTKEIK